jgi:hypothetical protein
LFTETQKFAFQVISAQKSFVLFAPALEDKTDWLVDIQTAIDEEKAKK